MNKLSLCIFTLFLTSLFMPIAFADTPPNDSEEIGTHLYSPTPHQKSFILASVPYQAITFSQADYPACRDGVTQTDTRTFTWSGTMCPSGYTARIIGSLVRTGGQNGQDTGNDINGFGLAQLNIAPDPSGGGYQITYCAFTFYGSGEGNAGNAWLLYTIYCDANSK